ncbi:hypothetical protein VNO80_15639 [Phaseolus coccineus]|uniref:DUF789 family protein n=1 Tax=Phaseolus coccineus TaxID=3886 RepID=A0AAN9MKM4_PHACN
MLRPSPYQSLLKHSPCSFTLLQCFFSPNLNLAVLHPFIHQFFIQKPLPPSQLFFRKKSLILSRPFHISAMSNSSGSYSNRTTGFERFYSPPVFQKLQRQQQKRLNADSVEPDLQTGSYEPALSTTASLSNLDRLLDAFTPYVPAHSSCKPKMKGRGTGYSSSNNSTGRLYIVLEDLWESYREWSAYGVEVPVSHDGGEDAKIYYAPSLSAIQLYAERRFEEDSSAVSSQETNCSAEELVYEFFEGAQPHIRPPLHDKASLVSILASKFPSLKKCRSCDISPSSWFSVAWYPIYKIPVVSSIKRVDASFLTYHSLTADSRSCFSLSFLVSDNFKYAGKKQPEFSSRKIRDDDGSLNISLPTFGLAAYKLKGSMLAPSRDSEWQKVDSLLEAATDWLQNLQANHPDYLYFVRHSTI